MALDIADIVRVSATIAPGGAAPRQFGRTLLVAVDEEFHPSEDERAQVFANMVEVAEVYDSDSEAYLAAQVYFSQSPYPQPLIIGQWAKTRKPDRLTGGNPIDLVNFHGRETVVTGSGTIATLVNFHGRATVVTGTGTVASLTTIQGITSGTVTFLGQTLTGLDFSAVTDYDGVASTLQTALRATSSTDLDNVEVIYDSASSAFVVTLPLDSSGVVPTASAAFTGDDADELGLDTATIVNGVDAIQSGTVTFAGETASGIDFSSVTDYDDVASALHTALRGATGTTLDAVDVVYDGDASAFVVTIPLAADGSATEVTSPFTGDDADELGLDTVNISAGANGIGAGSLTWQGATISGLDFTGATSYADVAQTLETAIRAVTASARADLRSASVEYDPSGFFRVSLGFRMSGYPYPILDAMTDVSQDTASALGLSGEIAVGIDHGHASESITQAMNAIAVVDDSWYFVAVDSSITDTTDAVTLAQSIEAQPYMLALDTVETTVVTPNESTSVAARLSALGFERTFVVWSRSSDHKALSMAARLSSVRFDGQNTLITAKFKSLPGTEPDTLTSTQQEELDRKRVGYYTRFGADAIFAEGWMLNGDWIDVRYWLDWITNAIQTEVYNLLRQHPSRVPQTNEGIVSITAAIERVCEAGRRNGGIAPGQVAESVANDIRLATNNPSFDGLLSLGYLVTVGSIADQLQSDRDARRSPPVKVWLKGSGAIHFATIELTFSG